MIHIAVCDDDLPTTSLIERLLLETQKSISEKIDISIFHSGETFTRAIQSGCPFDIILMDIEMEGIDGIKAGHVLRANDENDIVELIYISSHEEYHLQLFDLQPSGFIKKPIDPQIFIHKLLSTIQKVIRKRQQGKKNFLPIRQKGKELLIPFRDIMYLESNKRKVVLYTRNDKIEYYSTLNEEEMNLPVNVFIRIHQSYIVNFYFTKEISYKKIVLVTGKELPISENKNVSVRKHYLKFRGTLVG